MPSRLITVVTMTDHKDSNGNDLDAAWAAFEAEHKDDLSDVSSSSSARQFRKHAERKEKEALLSVDDLKANAFSRAGSGPRDFNGSSWLDTDDVMDQYGDDFVPPNPTIGPVSKSKLLFWGLLAVGLVGVIASVFVPSLTGVLSAVFGLCMLLGATGLIVRHKGHGFDDDGARV